MELGQKWNLNPVLLIIGFVFSIVLLPLKLAIELLVLKINFIFLKRKFKTPPITHLDVMKVSKPYSQCLYLPHGLWMSTSPRTILGVAPC